MVDIGNPTAYLMKDSEESISVISERMAHVLKAKHWLVINKLDDKYDTVAADIPGLFYTGAELPNEDGQKELTTDSLRKIGNTKNCYIFSPKEDVKALFIDTEIEPDSTISGIYKQLFVMFYKDSYVDIAYALKCINALDAETFTDLAKRSFKVVHYMPSELFLYVCAIIAKASEAAKTGIEPAMIVKFVNTIRSTYNDVPYHNWFHAVDVTQYVYCVIVNGLLNRYMTDTELFGLLISAVCHDANHNGMNNAYHRKADTNLAHMVRGNLPPLEQRHSYIAARFIKVFMPEMDKESDFGFSKFVIDCIMATDMEQHKKFIDAFAEIRDSFDKENADHRKLLAQMVLKCADLSNTVRDFDEAARMSRNLVDECRRQGRQEIKLGLAISPMCDPEDKSPLCLGQIGFYRFVAGPLMDQLQQFLPELDEHRKQFAGNLDTWEQQKKEL